MKNLVCHLGNVPNVTIITATYNRQTLLKTCIESVIAQTYTDWEYIIVDDGSEDNTSELVKTYMKRDSRIRYVSHSNRRQPMSLNVGLRMAAGTYTCFLDSDDYFLPNHIESRLGYLENHSSIDFVYGGLKVMGSDYVPDANDPTKKIHVDECAGLHSFFGETSIYREVGGFKDITIGDNGQERGIGVDKHMLDKIKKGSYSTKRLTEDKYRTAVYVRTEDSITVQFEKIYQLN
ncbi:MAG: glycosyltransferase family 2 protein [Chitinophagales bacterium]